MSGKTADYYAVATTHLSYGVGCRNRLSAVFVLRLPKDKWFFLRRYNNPIEII